MPQESTNGELKNTKWAKNSLLLYIVNFDAALRLFKYIFHEFTYLGHYFTSAFVLLTRSVANICLLNYRYVLGNCSFACEPYRVLLIGV